MLDEFINEVHIVTFRLIKSAFNFIVSLKLFRAWNIRHKISTKVLSSAETRIFLENNAMKSV